MLSFKVGYQISLPRERSYQLREIFRLDLARPAQPFRLRFPFPFPFLFTFAFPFSGIEDEYQRKIKF